MTSRRRVFLFPLVLDASRSNSFVSENCRQPGVRRHGCRSEIGCLPDQFRLQQCGRLLKMTPEKVSNGSECINTHADKGVSGHSFWD